MTLILHLIPTMHRLSYLFQYINIRLLLKTIDIFYIPFILFFRVIQRFPLIVFNVISIKITYIILNNYTNLLFFHYRTCSLTFCLKKLSSLKRSIGYYQIIIQWTFFVGLLKFDISHFSLHSLQPPFCQTPLCLYLLLPMYLSPLSTICLHMLCRITETPIIWSRLENIPAQIDICSYLVTILIFFQIIIYNRAK